MTTAAAAILVWAASLSARIDANLELEARNRLGYIPEAGTINSELGSEMILIPSANLRYTRRNLELRAGYGPRLYNHLTEAESPLLIQHRAEARVLGNWNRAFRYDLIARGTAGELDFSGAGRQEQFDGDLSSSVPEADRLRFADGQIRASTWWNVAPRWHWETQTGVGIRRGIQGSDAEDLFLLEQENANVRNRLRLNFTRRTTMRLEVDAGYRAFDDEHPRYYTLGSLLGLERHLSPRTSVLIAGGGLIYWDGLPEEKLEGPGGFLLAELGVISVVPLSPTKRLRLRANAASRPYFDSRMGTLDPRGLLRGSADVELTNILNVSAAANWLFPLRTADGELLGARQGQDRQVLRMTFATTYRFSANLHVRLGASSVSRWRERGEPEAEFGQELVAVVTLIARTELLRMIEERPGF